MFWGHMRLKFINSSKFSPKPMKQYKIHKKDMKILIYLKYHDTIPFILFSFSFFLFLPTSLIVNLFPHQIFYYQQKINFLVFNLINFVK